MLRAMRRQHSEGTIALMGATIHLLGEVREKVSSTQIRAAASKSVKQLGRYVPPRVAEYKKENLIRQWKRGKNGKWAKCYLSKRPGIMGTRQEP